MAELIGERIARPAIRAEAFEFRPARAAELHVGGVFVLTVWAMH